MSDFDVGGILFVFDGVKGSKVSGGCVRGMLTRAAVAESQLTLLQATGFHLRAPVGQVTRQDFAYRAKIEEWWVAPDKYRRTIESPEFSQTLMVNGSSASEKNTGDYFPFWLNELVTASAEPLPTWMVDALTRTDATIDKQSSRDNPTTCGSFPMRVDRWIVCFVTADGSLESVFSKGYAMQFEEYKRFGKKRVARRLKTYLEPGLEIDERVTELSELKTPDESMFEVKDATSPIERIHSVHVSEEVLRGMVLGSTEITWPPTGGGPARGGCAVYVSVDRTGRVREAWPEGCDNAGLQNSLREQVLKWKLKAPVSNGAPVQMESLMGFSFQTAVFESAGPPKISNVEARKLARNIVEPNFPRDAARKGTEFIVEVSVGDEGKVTGVQNPEKLNGPILMAIYKAVTQWQFKPYLRDGKAIAFNANVVFRMP